MEISKHTSDDVMSSLGKSIVTNSCANLPTKNTTCVNKDIVTTLIINYHEVLAKSFQKPYNSDYKDDETITSSMSSFKDTPYTWHQKQL